MMSFQEKLDGYVYLAMKYPKVDLYKLFNAYCEHLLRIGETSDSDDFLVALQAAGYARKAGKEMQEAIRGCLQYKPELALKKN